MKRFDKLLFVCKSNTALSPMAEAIASELLKLEDILIESRGLVVLFPEPVNPKAEAVLVSNGLTMKDHTSVAFGRDDFDERTLILAMSEQILEKMTQDYETPVNLYTLAGFTGYEEDPYDPYGGSLADYGRCYEQLREMLGKLAEILIQEEA